MERTLIIIKPDALKRGLVGKIIETFENVGMKLMVAKMLKPSADVIKNLKTEDPNKLGQFVYERLIKYWMEGPIIVMVWQGANAITVARKLRGHTIPVLAIPGTLHAQFSFDSSPLSASLDRVVKTFIHASGSTDEAEREIKYWFKDIKFKNYEREVDQLYLK